MGGAASEEVAFERSPEPGTGSQHLGGEASRQSQQQMQRPRGDWGGASKGGVSHVMARETGCPSEWGMGWSESGDGLSGTLWLL